MKNSELIKPIMLKFKAVQESESIEFGNVLSKIQKYKPKNKGNTQSLKYRESGPARASSSSIWKIIKHIRFLHVSKLQYTYDQLIKLDFELLEKYSLDVPDPFYPQNEGDFPNLLGLWRHKKSNAKVLLELLTQDEIGFEIYND